MTSRSVKARRLKSRYDLIGRLSTGKSVLDIGCVGHNLDDARQSRDPWLHGFLKKCATRVVGVDMLADDIKRMQSEGYEVHCADAQTMDLGETFDVIVAGAVIEHLENPGLFLDNMRKHLKPDGAIVLTTPNPFYTYNQITIALAGKLDVNAEHCIWLCPETMTTLAERSKLQLAEVYTTNYSQFFFRILRLPSVFRQFWAGTFVFVLRHGNTN